MKIEAGKKYVLNNGSVALALNGSSRPDYPFKMVYLDDNESIYCFVNESGISGVHSHRHEYSVKEECVENNFMDTLIYKDSVSGNEFKTLEEYVSFKENLHGRNDFHETMSNDMRLGYFSIKMFEEYIKKHPNNAGIVKYLSGLTKESNNVE